MSAAMHTPGPWFADEDGEIYSGDMLVAQICQIDPVTPVFFHRADSLLIAAAPELLEVARGILADDLLQYLPAEYVAKVRAAIDKAEGRP